MPKFLWTILVGALASLGIIFYLVNHTSPSNYQNVVIFLLLVFTTTSLLSSVPLYLLNYRKAPKYTNLREIYRRALKQGVLIGFLTTGICILLALRVLNAFTLTLFVLIIVLTYKFLNRS